MSSTVSRAAAARLPERAGRPARASIRKSDLSATTDVRQADPAPTTDVRIPEDRQARRVLLGTVLADALLILRIPRLKQQAAFLRRDPRTLRRWFDGLEPIPWEELLTIQKLQFPLMQALLESCQRDLVEIRTSISRRESAKSEAA